MTNPVSARCSDSTRLSRRKWYLMSCGWTLVLVPWLIAAATADRPVPVRVALTAAVVGYAALYVLGVVEVLARWTPLLVTAHLVVMTGLWLVIALGLGEGEGVLYTVAFLLVSAIALLPRAAGIGAALAIFACAAGVGLARGDVSGTVLIGLAALTIAMVVMFGLIRSNAQLREAREELARLAVNAERQRIARDLHDVLGHSLTTITVKAALARKLLEHGDAGRATAEIASVEQLGRQALTDVRATVAAHRDASLPAEIAAAREALRAAGIAARLPVAVDDVPPERQQVFAHVVREGVTNVIRHSGAATCTVRLRPDLIEVLDDGVGARSGIPAGSGLSGLAERAAAAGGRVEAGPGETGGYRLAATWPAADRAAGLVDVRAEVP